MTVKCRWCQDFFAVPTQKLQLCSKCTRLYQSGDYCCYPGLRSNRNKRHFTNVPGERGSVSQEQVRSLSTLRREFLRLIAPQQKALASEITPLMLYDFLKNFEVFVTADEARQILSSYDTLSTLWKYQHAVCCRVIDWWNLTEGYHGAGACYYNPHLMNSSSKIPIKLEFPRGVVYLPSWLE
jgi:hypothetical protein